MSGELSDAALRPAPQASGGLLERDDAIALLQAATAGAAAGAGRIAVVSGEAGIGKTALARRFVAELGDPVRVLWGACDDLAVARPFGPFWDIAEQTGPALSAAIDAQDAGAVGQALRDVMASGRPCVCVLEDCHWADEATLDVISHVGRRIARSPALLLVTFRDDELTLEHRLRAVVGSIPPDDVVRIPLEPLSQGAVAALSAGRTNAAALHSATRGNPFLVSEVLASGPGAVPGSVQDAVLARAARLSDAGRSLAELVSVLPSRAELALIESALPESEDALAECTRLSVLELDGAIVRFRHELARQALEAALSEVERRRLNALVLRCLCESGADPARLAHHAARTGDGALLLEFALAAASRAAGAGAHRDAFASYVRARPELGRLDERRRAEILELFAVEAHFAGEIGLAIELQGEAVGLWRLLDDRIAVGAATSALAVLHMWSGDSAAGLRLSTGAVSMLEPLPVSPAHARAYASHALLLLIESDDNRAIAWSQRAAAIADELGETSIALNARVTIGSARFHRDPAEGGVALAAAVAAARDAGDLMAACRGLSNLASGFMEVRRFADCEATIATGLAYAEEHELDGIRLYMLSIRAVVHFLSGQWAAAHADVEESAELDMGATRAGALAVLGALLARSGDATAEAVLGEAWELNSSLSELVGMMLVACARAELAVAVHDPAAVAAATDALVGRIHVHGNEWDTGALAFWRSRAGLPAADIASCAEPFRLQMSGDWEAAAAAWERIGAPYERALALLDSDREQPLLEALAIADGLGAAPLAGAIRGKLRRLGARSIPRGPRPGTRANAGGLSRRQVEVLELVAQGLSNPEIARRLFLTPKTVEHHVGAILRKLRATRREDAVATARSLGLLAART